MLASHGNKQPLMVQGLVKWILDLNFSACFGIQKRDMV